MRARLLLIAAAIVLAGCRAPTAPPRYTEPHAAESADPAGAQPTAPPTRIELHSGLEIASVKEAGMPIGRRMTPEELCADGEELADPYKDELPWRGSMHLVDDVDLVTTLRCIAREGTDWSANRYILFASQGLMRVTVVTGVYKGDDGVIRILTQTRSDNGGMPELMGRVQVVVLPPGDERVEFVNMPSKDESRRNTNSYP